MSLVTKLLERLPFHLRKANLNIDSATSSRTTEKPRSSSGDHGGRISPSIPFESIQRRIGCPDRAQFIEILEGTADFKITALVNFEHRLGLFGSVLGLGILP